MNDVVLDASALLAVIWGEPGADDVGPVMRGALISTVNLSEVAAILAASGMPMNVVRSDLDSLPLHRIAFDENLAFRAAALRGATRHAGLSFGDRACLALAQARDGTALTADRAWSRLGLGIDVRVIR